MNGNGVRRAAGLLVLVLVATVTVACSGSSDEASRQIGGRSVSEAEFRFGAAPAPPGDDVAYQPDVLLVGGGPAAVREMTGDGLQVTLDPGADGVDSLTVDRILYASGRVVGRVVAIEDSDRGRTVTLVPVELTDIYETLVFDTSYDIDPAALAIYTAPDTRDPVEPIKLLPEEDGQGDGDGTGGGADDGTVDGTDEGAGPTTPTSDPDDPTPADAPPSAEPGDDTTDTTDPADGDATGDGAQSLTAASVAEPPTIEMPRVHLVAGADPRRSGAASLPSVAPIAQTPPAPAPPLPGPVASPTAVGTGDFKIQPIASGGIGAQLAYDKNGTTILAKVQVQMQSPRLVARLDLRGGRINTAALELHGGAGFDASFEAGSRQGLSANIDANIAFPVDLTVPIGGVVAPLSVTFSQRLIVKSAFSSKNSTLSAAGNFGFQGSFTMGIVNGRQTLGGPSRVSVNKSLLNSTKGVALGPQGLIIGHAMRVMVGVGAFGFATGLYVDFITSFSVTRGSDLGIVMCRGGTLDMNVAGGVGYSLPKPIVSGINVFLRALNLKQINQVGGIEFARTKLISLSDTQPKSKICTG